MTLYAVVVKNVYPHQCIVVWDRESSAAALSEHLNEHVSPDTTVEPVDSFFPDRMVNADTAWLVATDSYLRGDHHNTSA